MNLLQSCLSFTKQVNGFADLLRKDSTLDVRLGHKFLQDVEVVMGGCGLQSGGPRLSCWHRGRPILLLKLANITQYKIIMASKAGLSEYTGQSTRYAVTVIVTIDWISCEWGRIGSHKTHTYFYNSLRLTALAPSSTLNALRASAARFRLRDWAFW